MNKNLLIHRIKSTDLSVIPRYALVSFICFYMPISYYVRDPILWEFRPTFVMIFYPILVIMTIQFIRDNQFFKSRVMILGTFLSYLYIVRFWI